MPVVGPGPVSDDSRLAAQVVFCEAEVVELTLLVGVTLLLNRYATSLALPVNDDVVARLASEGFSRS